MHIVHISSVHQAGDPRIRLKQLGAVVAAGWRATLVTGDLEATGGDGVEVITVTPGRRGRLRRMLLTAPRAVLAARRLRADVYHFHDPELLPWATLLLGAGRVVIYDIHEDYASGIAQKGYLPRLLRGPLAAIAGGVERLLAAPFHQIIAERYYKRRFPKAVEILNYPSVTTPLGPPAFDAASTALLYTGNVTRERGAMVLAEIAATSADLSVTSIGQCPPALAAAMRDTAGAAHLTLIGAGAYVPFSEIAAAYRRPWLAGLAVFPDAPHYREKELTKFFEFMAAGLPIIASDFPAWRQLIADNGVGLCVPAGDAAAAATAARWLRAHPEEAAAMARRGQELVATRFNWQAEAARLIALYRDLMPARSTAGGPSPRAPATPPSGR